MKKIAFIFIIFALATSLSGAIDGFSRAERKKEAESLREAITRIDRYIPNLSPDQKAFIASEQVEIAKIENEHARMNRQLALYRTKEAQISKVKWLCTEGMRSLDFVIGDVSEEEELLGWMTFVALFMDPVTLNEGLSLLQETHLLSKKDIESMRLVGGDFGYGALFSWRARLVMEDIVLPLYARGARKKGP